jgi:ribosomal protein S18 acetylase RimI-like enzyme
MKDLSKNIDAYANDINDFYMVGQKPVFSDRLLLNKNLVCRQMVLEKPIVLNIEEEIKELHVHYTKELFALVNLVLPGYYKMKTARLGSYFGIFKKGELVAATGERMKMNSFTEVSAVVTHPEHSRKGYSQQLIAYATEKIFKENKIPYLHVADTNSAAISLYKKLGFKERRKISFWNLIKK